MPGHVPDDDRAHGRRAGAAVSDDPRGTGPDGDAVLTAVRSAWSRDDRQGGETEAEGGGA